MVSKAGIANVANECRNSRWTSAEIGLRLGRSLGPRGLRTEQVSGMRNARRSLALAVAALAVSALPGCSEDPASTSPPTESTSTSTPSASTATTEPPSDSEVAGESAGQVVRDYIAVVDRLRKDRKQPLGQLKAVAIGGELDAQTLFTHNQRKAGNRQTGDTQVLDVVVQSVNLDKSQKGQAPTVQLDVCWDVSAGDVLDRDGNSIVSPDRPGRGWTRYTVANHRWKTHPDDGWRVASSQDLEKAPCSAA